MKFTLSIIDARTNDLDSLSEEVELIDRPVIQAHLSQVHLKLKKARSLWPNIRKGFSRVLTAAAATHLVYEYTRTSRSAEVLMH